MKLVTALFVILHYPLTPAELAEIPDVKPYHKARTEFVTDVLPGRYTSEECQAKAAQLNGMRGQPLPGVAGRVAGAFCGVPVEPTKGKGK